MKIRCNGCHEKFDREPAANYAESSWICGDCHALMQEWNNRDSFRVAGPWKSYQVGERTQLMRLSPQGLTLARVYSVSALTVAWEVASEPFRGQRVKTGNSAIHRAAQSRKTLRILHGSCQAICDEELLRRGWKLVGKATKEAERTQTRAERLKERQV